MPPAKTPTKSSAKAAKPPTKTAAEKALERLQAQFDKNYGAGVMQIGAEPVPYKVISTGSIDLDRKLVVGGWVMGRINEIWGPEGVGKSSLAIFSCVEALKADPRMVLWIDVEHRHDKKWMRDHGLDLKRTAIIQPNDAEDVADMVKDACRSDHFSMIVVDSVGAMIPRKEKEKAAEDAVVGMQAKIVTRMVKINAVEADAHNVCVLLINQVRAAIGSYGADQTSGGGYALKHGTTMKLYLRPESKGQRFVGSGERKQRVGHGVIVKVERNSVGLAYQTAKFTMFYLPTPEYGPMGLDWADEAARVGVEMGVIQQSGGWFTSSISGERWNGLPKVIEALRADRQQAMKIREKVLEMLEEEIVLDGGVSLDDEDDDLDMPSFSTGLDAAIPDGA